MLFTPLRCRLLDDAAAAVASRRLLMSSEIYHEHLPYAPRLRVMRVAIDARRAHNMIEWRRAHMRGARQ